MLVRFATMADYAAVQALVGESTFGSNATTPGCVQGVEGARESASIAFMNPSLYRGLDGWKDGGGIVVVAFRDDELLASVAYDQWSESTLQLAVAPVAKDDGTPVDQLLRTMACTLWAAEQTGATHLQVTTKNRVAVDTAVSAHGHDDEVRVIEQRDGGDPWYMARIQIGGSPMEDRAKGLL